jgi:shikimate dehydrogenase
MSGAEFHLGLTGYPLSHSLSPLLHQAALAACSLTGDYQLFPVEPDEEADTKLKALCERVRSGELDGLNVTIPFKQALFGCLHEVSESARAVGAVNTLYSRAGRLLGENTDIAGFKRDLSSFIDLCIPQKALVLGAGGAARSVVFVLMQAGWQVTLAARRQNQASQLADDLNNYARSHFIEIMDLEQLSSLNPTAGWGLVVNTTPLGMFPNMQASPWPQTLELPITAAVYDLIYNPGETRLMQHAAAAGIRCRNGLGMLVEQAAQAFEIWTGKTADRAAMIAALQKTNTPESGRTV